MNVPQLAQRALPPHLPRLWTNEPDISIFLRPEEEYPGYEVVRIHEEDSE